MTEINTFSALIDDTVTRTGRANLRADMLSYARQAMRECQTLVLAGDDMIEDELTATSDAFIWDKPEYFRQLLAVKFPGIVDPQGQPIFSKHAQPGKSQNKKDYFHYLTGGSWAFHGVSSGTLIDVAYFVWFTKLAYYQTVTDRPATYELETGTWSYLTATTDEEQLAARLQVTNWMLTDWYDMVLEGTCAKVWKAMGDPRSSPSFALFKSLQKDMVTSITQDSYSSITG